MLRSLARRLLKIPVLRYVDDYFGADRLQCAAGALSAFARSVPEISHMCICVISPQPLPYVRLVRVCLGHSAVAERKLEVAMPLTILGIQVAISDLGVRFTLNDSKRVEWQKQLVAALDDAKLCPGM